MTAPVTAASRYESLRISRDPFLRRARAAANLTIPSLMPPEGSAGADLPQPYQSVGARGVNNLAAKLLLALFPPGSSFFRLELDPKILEDLKAKAPGEDVVGQVQAALGKVEQAAQVKFTTKRFRARLFLALKHLVAVGNALLFVLPEGGLKFFPLSAYCVKRDLEGEVVEIVVKECLHRRTISGEVQEIVARHSGEAEYADDKDIDLYTWLTRKTNGTWRVHQEVCGEIVESTRGFYPKDKLAWFPLRWTEVPGEDYGRGQVDEYMGDLGSAESLAQSLVDGAAAASKTVFLRNPGGMVTARKLAKAPNLAVIDGMPNDVSVLRVEKVADFQFAQAELAGIIRRLEQAFLLTSSIQRNAERVTAEEVRIMAAELEQALGGVYSVLAEELQRPLVIRLLHQMQRSGDMPALPDKAIIPQIVTGLEGLGRTTDAQKLDIFVGGLQQAFGPEAVAEYIRVGDYATRKAAALQIDTGAMVRTEEEVQQARAQKAQMALMEKLGPNAIQANAARDVAATKADAQAAPTE